MRLELTRRGDYAIRAMLALARQPDEGWISVPTVSSAMAIPERFLPRVMADLVHAGLAVGRRGRKGGYRLARPASTISLLEIIGAAEPEPEIRVCILRGGPCGRDGKCDVHDAFAEAREAMFARLGTTLLGEVAGRHT